MNTIFRSQAATRLYYRTQAECPLWVISGHTDKSVWCLLLLRKRTLAEGRVLFANWPEPSSLWPVVLDG